MKIVNIDSFKSGTLENKYTELIKNLNKEKLRLVDPEKLKIELPNVPLEDYEPEDVT